MARIAGINIPPHQHAEIGLTAIFGIGRSRAREICEATGIAYSKKVKDLTDTDLEKIRDATARFTIEGELDDISGLGQTQAAHDLCTGLPKNAKRHLTVKGAGHYGIFSGRRWRDVVYPEVREFIRAHAKEPKATSRSRR